VLLYCFAFLLCFPALLLLTARCSSLLLTYADVYMQKTNQTTEVSRSSWQKAFYATSTKCQRCSMSV
jgi:hypothetical protein